MYLIFVGTTDYIGELKSYLSLKNHTLLEGTATWMGAPLNSQVIVMFDKEEALKLRGFLMETCAQKEVPIHFIQTTKI